MASLIRVHCGSVNPSPAAVSVAARVTAALLSGELPLTKWNGADLHRRLHHPTLRSSAQPRLTKTGMHKDGLLA